MTASGTASGDRDRGGTRWQPIGFPDGWRDKPGGRAEWDDWVGAPKGWRLSADGFEAAVLPDGAGWAWSVSTDGAVAGLGRAEHWVKAMVAAAEFIASAPGASRSYPKV